MDSFTGLGGIGRGRGTFMFTSPGLTDMATAIQPLTSTLMQSSTSQRARDANEHTHHAVGSEPVSPSVNREVSIELLADIVERWDILLVKALHCV